MSRFQFVADYSTTYEVKRLCELVEIERASYYAWKAAAPAREARAAADAELAERIRAVHKKDNTVGAPRVTAELNDGVGAGERVNHKRVARVMRGHGIVGYRRRRKVRTTVPEPADAKVPDLLNRDFTAQAPNQRYVGDITYLPIADGSNLYLATVIDCCSRRLAGWAIADHMRTELVEDALKAAAATRGSLDGAVFHSDHGSVYTSKIYARLSSDLGVTQSMGAVGTSADNSLAESFNATLKREVLKTRTADPTSSPVAARCSGGSRATTPAAGTPGAATSPRSTTRTTTRLRSRQPRNHTPCPRTGGKARRCPCQRRNQLTGSESPARLPNDRYGNLGSGEKLTSDDPPSRGGRFAGRSSSGSRAVSGYLATRPLPRRGRGRAAGWLTCGARRQGHQRRARAGWGRETCPARSG